MTEEQQKLFDEWLSTRPESIKQLAAKYPPADYRIKEGAPYGISCPGTKVTINSYIENGDISVIVMAEDKLPAGLEHERKLAEQYEKLHMIEELHAQNVTVQIDPKWLEKIN